MPPRNSHTSLQKIWDLIGFPLRISLPYDCANRLGFSSTRDERISVTLPFCTGRLLDVGCGENSLIRSYGDGIGVDIFAWDGVDICVNARYLPFQDESFDTVSFLASLNHIPDRIGTMKECYRILKPDGRVLISMIGPIVGWINHRVCVGWWDPDIQKRGIAPGEVWGISQRELLKTITAGGFTLEREIRFFYHINCLYIARK